MARGVAGPQGQRLPSPAVRDGDPSWWRGRAAAFCADGWCFLWHAAVRADLGGRGTTPVDAPGVGTAVDGHVLLLC